MMTAEKNILTNSSSSNRVFHKIMRLFVFISAIAAIAFTGSFWKQTVETPVVADANGKTAIEASVVSSKTSIKKHAYIAIIEMAAKTHNVPAALIAAVIKAESGFNPKAMSNKGAIGLMQITLSTSRYLKVSNPFDPVQNILGGAKYLRELLDRFHGNMTLAVAAYNAGPGAVSKHGGIPPYSQTRKYVPKVLKYYNDFESGVYID